MRAAVMRSNRFWVEEIPTPTPGQGEVLVRTRACGICGSDLHFFKHADEIVERAQAMGAPVDDLKRGLECGLVLGHEFVAEIVAFGDDKQRTLAVGDRVCSMPFVLKDAGPALLGSNPETPGAYAEYMVLSEALLVPVPPNVSDEAAALTEPFGIAIHAVNRAALQPGEVAIVVGCGPIGLAVAAVLRMRGVETILASDLSPRRRDLALQMGAHEALNPKVQSPIARAAALAPGRPLVIFENTGAPGMIGNLVLEAPAQSRLVVTGIAANDESFIPMIAITKELRLDFVIYYTPEEFAEALDVIARDAVNWAPLITGTVGLEGVGEAFTALSDPEAHAKILIDPWREGGLS